jgi:hypothetical protein
VVVVKVVIVVVVVVVLVIVKVKVIPQEAEVAQEFPCRLRPRIFVTFSSTMVVGRQPYASAAFTLGEIPGTHFQGAQSTPGNMVSSVGKKSPVIPPGIDPGNIRLAAQYLNHYATPGLSSSSSSHSR